MSESRWKAALLALWTLAAFTFAAESASRTGLGGRPWYGWWDAIIVGAAQPFTVRFLPPNAGGASAAAGIRGGDRVDLRELGIDARARVMWQIAASEPTSLTIHRNAKALPLNLTGTTLWQGPAIRRLAHVFQVLPAIFFLGCALLIIRRRAQTYEGRSLSLFLLILVVGEMTRPNGLLVPKGTLYVLTAIASNASSLAAALILIRLSSHFGIRSAWRSVLEYLAYTANTITFAGAAAGCIGILTLWFDPVPFVMGSFWGVFRIVAAAAVAGVTVVAVTSASRTEQPRAGWLLLPLPLILAMSLELDNTIGVQSWTMLWTLIISSAALSFAGAALVTYALLKRRVLDVGFVVGRSIVVALLSVIVVVAFVLLEWILGPVVANVSHATGVAANAALALVLGLSIRFIHKRVDDLVDNVMFRKRREDTNALRDFSKEAAFVTGRDALADLAIEKMRRHTDARSGGLFFRDDGVYRAARAFNNSEPAVSENDAAVLALKAWHKPVDPHAYQTALKGDLALPMIARGQVVGFVLCGERASGEAYAPDEADALAQFAQGVGAAYDGLEKDKPHEQDAVLRAIRDVQSSIDRHFARD